jgi:uncharacterized RDD family membrane protein YckC
MSWQTPGKDDPEPTEPAVTPPGSPEADAETTRVPVESGSVEPVTPPPAAGLISAEPVGWTDPNTGAPASTPPTPEGPAVAWAPPVRPVAAQVVDGLVIAGTFTRLVAYTIDTLFLGMLNVVALGAIGAFSNDRDNPLTLAVSIGFVIVDCLYFVGLWTSGWHATLGMRLLGLRLVAAATATTLSRNDALLRWIALSGAVAILALIPRLAGTLGLLSALWVLVLLITTATHPMHQGLHDRWARSVVVQPAPGGSGAAIASCLVIVFLLFLVVPIVLLAFAAPQLEDILRQIGESV